MKNLFSSIVDRLFGKKQPSTTPEEQKLSKEEVAEAIEAAPNVEPPKLESPKIEIPKVEAPKVEAPKQNPPPRPKPSPQSPSKPQKDVGAKPTPTPQQSKNLPTPTRLSSSIEFINPNHSKLSDKDFEEAAKLLDCEEAIIRAVVEIESSGGGFLPSNRPKILFEAHLFARATKNVYNKTHPEISSQTWNRQLYKGGEKEYDRLDQALKLNESAALGSCSYGMFQILASNFKSCGFDSVKEFVEAQIKGEKEQLESFINFIKTNKLDRFLKALNFPMFARMYNGPSYQSNKYDIKLQNSYEKWKQKLNK